MKITKRQLRKIIKEEKARLNEMKLMDPVAREQLAIQGGDEALREIQNAMGITDGGVAGQWPGFDRLGWIRWVPCPIRARQGPAWSHMA